MSEHFRLITAQIVAEFKLTILLVQAEGTRACMVQATLQMRVELARHYLTGKVVEDPAVRS